MSKLVLLQNLDFLATRANRRADQLDGPTSGPTQLSAPQVLRDRSRRYREAQAEVMVDAMNPAHPFANILLDNRAKWRAIRWASVAYLAGVVGTLAFLAVIQ